MSKEEVIEEIGGGGGGMLREMTKLITHKEVREAPDAP